MLKSFQSMSNNFRYIKLCLIRNTESFLYFIISFQDYSFLVVPDIIIDSSFLLLVVRHVTVS